MAFVFWRLLSRINETLTVAKISGLIIPDLIPFIFKTSLDIIFELFTGAANDLLAIELFRLLLLSSFSVRNWWQVVVELGLIIGTLVTFFVDALALDPGICNSC